MVFELFSHFERSKPYVASDSSSAPYSCDFLTSTDELPLSKQMITASAGLAGAVFGLIAEHAGLCFMSFIYQSN